MRERKCNTALYHSHFVGKLAVRMARKKETKARVTAAVLGGLQRPSGVAQQKTSLMLLSKCVGKPEYSATSWSISIKLDEP